MKSLLDKIIAQQCPKHDSPYCFIYKGVEGGNESILMCDVCQNPQNANGMISIRKVFKFLEGRQVQGNQNRLKLTSLWQQFKHYSVQIQGNLRDLEDLMDQLLNSINENQVISMLNDENVLNAQPDIQSLGQYLGSLIEQDSKGQFTFKYGQQEQQVRQYEEDCFLQCDQIFEGQRKANDELMCLLSLIQSSIEQVQNINKIIKRNLNSVDVTNYIYETTQILQLRDYCHWISLDHRESQLIAAINQSLILYQLTIEQQWIEMQVLSDFHTAPINKVKFNHNSTLIASCGDDNLIIIWSKQLNGQWSILDTLNGPHEKVQSICFNHDSSLLASGSNKGTIQIHNINNGKWELQQSLTEHKYTIIDECFNNDSTIFASPITNFSIIIWKLNNQGKWTVFQTLKEHTKRVNTIKFNLKANQLISSSCDKTIKIWGVNQDSKWKLMHTLTGHINIVTSAYFNKYSNMIVSGSNDKSIKIWKINQEGQWKCTQTINQHQDYVTNAILNSDSTMIISSSFDRTIRIHKIS